MQQQNWTKNLFYGAVAIGIIVSILTEAEKISPEIRALCGGDTGACAEVGASKYSSLFGIPLGILGFVSWFVLAGLYHWKRAVAPIFIAILMGAEVYFLYIQFAVIGRFCPLCMMQFAAVLVLFIMFMVNPAGFIPSSNSVSRQRNMLLVASVLFLAFIIPHKLNIGTLDKNATSITSYGDPSSRYRLEVFANYECPHCAHYEETVKLIIRDYPQLYIIFRDYIFANSKLSPLAVAYTGSIAYYEGQEAYLKARMEAFENQKNLFGYIVPLFKKIPDDKKMKAALTKKIENDMAIVKKLDIRGTPTTLLLRDGKIVDRIGGNLSYGQARVKIDALLAGDK